LAGPLQRLAFLNAYGKAVRNTSTATIEHLDKVLDEHLMAFTTTAAAQPSSKLQDRRP
jgi:hypothetical protein